MTEYIINAKYPGRCIKCGGQIKAMDETYEGDKIYWEKGTGAWHVQCPKPTNGVVTPAKKEQVPLEDGIYLKDGVVYKIQHAIHGSGKQYAKKLIVHRNGPETRASFEYTPGMINNLANEDRMTLEQAQEFGAIYGCCANCGRTLTNEGSIEAGIGPVCLGHFFPNVSKKEQRRLARVVISQGVIVAKSLYAQTPKEEKKDV